ncbi:alpha/beta fold hydrolase [Candidatus Neomarinimicrobiota bacterium]
MKHLKILYIFIFILTYSCTKAPNNIAISSDGVEISFDKQGKGKPTLVFVHGWCCDKSYWKFQVSHFSKQHEVITIDLAGHGESGLNRQNWTIESFGNDVVAVIEKLDLDQVILIGHSMGGQVNIETARQIPKRIIGLVGVDTYHNFEDLYTPEQVDGFLSPFKTDFVETSSNFVRSMFPPKADSTLVKQIVTDMSSAPPEVAISALRELFTYNQEEALKEVQIPIYCINSDKYSTNVEAGQRHALSFELKLMPGIGHFVMMEDPEQFNQLLTKTVDALSL